MMPGISQESIAPAPQASSDWFGHTWRLMKWNLKLARRRLMSKILLSLLLVGLLLVIGVVLLSFIVVNNISTSDLTQGCATPVATTTSDGTSTISSAPGCDPGSIALEAQQVQGARRTDLQLLSFPTILVPIGGYTGFMGIILLCILAGAVIGSEYSFGTQRLALSRGVSRAQVLAGQVGALALLALGVAGFMLLLGALIGVVLGTTLGGTIPAIGPDGFFQLLGFWLVLALRLFAYTLVALLLATLSSSTAAGIAGSLGYLIFELIALPIISAIGIFSSGSAFGTVLSHVQDAFLGPNLNGLLMGVNTAPLDLGGNAAAANAAASGQTIISPFQGLIVVLLYCVLLVGLSYWVLRKRDVTN